MTKKKIPARLCPLEPGEMAEMYLLNKLSPQDERIFEEHYLTCRKCADVVEETRKFLAAFRLAVGLPGSPSGNEA